MMLQEFLGNSMLQVGLNILPGNPVTTCRVNGKFAFIELRTPQEAANALNLNNIPFMGATLRVGRSIEVGRVMMVHMEIGKTFLQSKIYMMYCTLTYAALISHSFFLDSIDI